MKGSPSKQDILNAMKQIDLHGIPDGFDKSRYYYLIHPITQKTYPPKAVWGLATGRKDFNAQSAKRWLEAKSFFVHDIRLEKDSISFQKQIATALQDHEKRRVRLKTASPQAEAFQKVVTGYKRNPDVVAERLFLANGICETCHTPAPFHRKKNGTPYLEVHHVIFLSDGGDDTVENTQALCPNCHRKAHHG